MKTILTGNKKESGEQAPGVSNKNIPKQLVYPAAEDIYNVYRKEDDYNPEDKLKNKVPNPLEKEGANAIADDDTYSSGLDVPGAELDDKLENTGSEDEENNYYSIGGDDHNNLEEDKGD